MRRGVAVLAAAVAGVLAIAIAVPPSAASWVDQEWIAAPVGALACGDPATVDTTAAGRMIAGTVSGQSLDPVAAIDGIAVTNTGLASTATSAATTTSLGDDAWTSSFALSTLSGLAIGGGVTLPLATNTGSYTQYGRATSAGLSVGAAGAVTSAGSGVVALETPASATPRLAELRLSGLLDASLPGLGVATAQLADVRLRVGTLGAIASYDSCSSLWNDAAPGSALTREYLVNDLGLTLTSSRVTDTATAIRTALTNLETTLDALAGAKAVPAALQSTLQTALNLNLAGIGVSLGSIDALNVAVDVDLAPVRALVAGNLTDGVVTVNLTTGAITADLEALFGAAYSSSTGLNGQAPNTAVLTPAVLSAISTRVGGILSSFVSTTIASALTSAIDNTTVVVSLSARLNALVPNALVLASTFTGTIGGFTGVAGHATPVAASTLQVVPGLGALGAVSATLGAVVGVLLGGLSNAAAGVLPSIGSTVVAPLKATATGAASTTISGLTTSTIPSLVTNLGAALTALGTLVDVTVNARPDAAGSVGAPAPEVAGRYFETALHVGIVNGSATSVASVFLANASVGPNALR